MSSNNLDECIDDSNNLFDVVNIEKNLNLKFPVHPFDQIPDDSNCLILLANYLAMSQAFPYIQAGSQKELIFYYMENNTDIPLDVELTSVVGNFLCWDETGGLYPTIAMGLKALPRILETHRFHSNLLKKDCFGLVGKDVLPDYSPVTKRYLNELYHGFASLCPHTRVASMVSFETHANRMIQSLWLSLSKKFGVDKKSLNYFSMHVGGDDPAEKYHVQMTNSLINKIIKADSLVTFMNKISDAYSLHFNWCDNIVKLR